MTIELIAMIFDQDEDVSDARRALDTMRQTTTFGLENAVLVEKDAAGKAFVHQYSREPVSTPVRDDTLLILFANVIFTGSATERERDLVIAELDEVFLEEIADAWQPSTSALLIIIPRLSLVDAQRLLKYLAEYSGTLIRTTFPEQTIEFILMQSKSVELPSMNNKEL